MQQQQNTTTEMHCSYVDGSSLLEHTVEKTSNGIVYE